MSLSTPSSTDTSSNSTAYLNPRVKLPKIEPGAVKDERQSKDILAPQSLAIGEENANGNSNGNERKTKTDSNSNSNLNLVNADNEAILRALGPPPPLEKIPQGFECYICFKIHRSQQSLTAHLFAAHGQRKYPTQQKYTCSQCSKQFGTSRSLRDHVKIHSRARAWTCDHCGKAFNLKKELTKHLEMYHYSANNGVTDSQGRYTCIYCKQKYKTLELHVRYAHFQQDRLPCPHCNETFARPSTLKNHITIHSSDKPFKCDECDSRFRIKNLLKQHKQHVHCQTRNYICNQCQKAFKTRQSLRSHMKAVHNTDL